MSSMHTELQEGVQALQEILRGARLDLLEICAPWDSPLTKAVEEAGGRAVALGLQNGYDLTTRSGFRKAAQFIREMKPRCVHISPPCFPWSPMQNLNHSRDQIQRLFELRRKHRKLLHHCRRLAEIQVLEMNSHLSFDEKHMDFHHAGFEHPLRAVSWGLDEVRVVVRLCGGERFRVDGCRHGLINKDTHNLFHKPWGWCTTHQGIRTALELKCNHQPWEYDRIEGKHTSQTAVYPFLLCRRFAKALMKDLEPLFSVFREVNGVFLGENPEEEEHDGNSPENVVPVEDAEPGEALRFTPAELQQKLRTIHRNLGHPCQSTMLRLLRDAGADAEVLSEAAKFECPECLQRGRRSSAQPVAPAPVREKWHTVSVDTFWWKYPEKALAPKEKNQHVVGLSIFDEATDFHGAVLIRMGSGGPMHNISGEEFTQAFSEGWLQRYPAPVVLRYDEEGFFRGLKLKEFLEKFGIKLEPIAGESAWQMGKHSRHLQTLKEQMNLLASELGTSFEPHQLLALALSAKNSLHNIRGYSPHQWAFGRSHQRIASFLQNYDNLPLQSQRQELDFEESLQVETKAQRIFLEADAKRRLARALRHRCRPLKEFQTGQLVYYFRKGRKEGSRYGGKWYGPARVLCHERTNLEAGREHLGSIVWVSHAGFC